MRPQRALAALVLVCALATSSSAQTVLFRVNTGGPSVPAIDGGLAWTEDSQETPAPWRNDGSSVAAFSISNVDASVPASTPIDIFQTERWDPEAAPTMQWSFPVGSAGTYEVRFYYADGWSGTTNPGDRVFDVSAEGFVVDPAFDAIQAFGDQTAGMRSFLVTSDASLDLEFAHITQNPMICGLEVLAVDPDGYLGAAPFSLDFGQVEVGMASSTLQVTLENLGDPGDATINVTGSSLVGEFTDDLGTPAISPGGTVTVNLTFAPTAVGVEAGSLTINHDGTNSPLVITLAGEGFDPGSPPVSFGASGLAGEISNNPTSLQFGPDDRLYVAQQNGLIYAYSVQRNAANDYAVTATETIDLIQQIPNHNDDGSVAPTVNTRQVTGLLAKGTATNPVLYVSSSDPRIEVNNTDPPSLSLDTNSGVITRLTWNGSSWDRLDLVRGLPRSEENHATNGMVIDETTNVLYVMSGGHTNMGAPSTNFSGLTEYALSAALLSVDLTAIGETTYDLPTLDDEDRPGTTDSNDPFGGNDGKNQAMLVPGSPVQVYSPGYRNAYDVVLTEDGRLFTVDNGPNGGWGGIPTGCSNTFVDGGSTYGDGLHFITAGYYAGHPNPVRASLTNTFNPTNPQAAVTIANPVECTYQIPGVEDLALEVFSSSTNGICEYTASNFGGQLAGQLLTASFGGQIWRLNPNATGDALLEPAEALFSNFGSSPLDVWAQGDQDAFPGTIWAATYGSDTIVVFEPTDYDSAGGPVCTGAYSLALDEDGDGYSNADEIDSGTNPCSAASIPADWDGDFLSDLNDNDDDNDGTDDTADLFALDPFDGMTTSLPVNLSWDNGAPNPGGLMDLGIFGLMNNGTDYSSRFDGNDVIPGGAAGVVTVTAVTAGTAEGGANDQDFGFQFGANVQPTDPPFQLKTRINSPFGGITPAGGQSMGTFFGTGTQDDYLKIVTTANGGAGGIEVGLETAGSYVGTVYADSSGLAYLYVELMLDVDPATGLAQPSISLEGAAPILLGAPIACPTSWFAGTQAVAFGLISSSVGATPFSASWDFLEVASQGAPTPTAAARLTMNAGGGINASTYGNGSFVLTNESTAGERITRVSLDLSTALLPDLVFDPNGTAGDVVAKCFSPNSGETATGFVTFGDNCLDPFSSPHDGGYDAAEMTFTDFDPAETFTFSVDVDPTSIQGTSAPGPNESGSVSGLELIGATVEVEFDDGTILTMQPWREGSSLGGSEGLAQSGLPAAPGVQMLSVTAPAYVGDTSQIVRVSGLSGLEVRLLQVEAGLFTSGLPGGGFDLDEFEGNSVIQVIEHSATIEGTGYVDLPVTLEDTHSEAGLNVFVAALRVPGASDFGRVSAPLVVQYDAAVGVSVAPAPTEFSFAPNFPNPFRDATSFAFALPRPEAASLVIYDVAGRRIATLLDDRLAAGRYVREWNGQDDAGRRVASGVYFARFTSGRFAQVKRVQLLR